MLDALDPFASYYTVQAYHAVLQIIGAIGCLIYVGGYLLVQSGRVCGNGGGYSASKLIAASFVLASLVTSFNLASFLIQISFIAISIYGLWYRLSGRITARLDRSAAALPQPCANRFVRHDMLAESDARSSDLTNPLISPLQGRDCQVGRQGHIAARCGPDGQGM